MVTRSGCLHWQGEPYLTQGVYEGTIATQGTGELLRIESLSRQSLRDRRRFKDKLGIVKSFPGRRGGRRKTETESLTLYSGVDRRPYHCDFNPRGIPRLVNYFLK